MKKMVFLVVLVYLGGAVFPAEAGNTRAEKHLEELGRLEDELVLESKKIEEIIFKRGAKYEDARVETYLNAVAKKILPQDFKNEKIKFGVKIIRDPTVNAFAMPNGTVYIHTGALSRLENEAQLAFLLGHEISHVINKDGVYATDSFHNKTVSYKLFDLVLSPAAVFFGTLGDLVQSGFALLYVSTVTGYSREQEARADMDSIGLAAKAGYEPNEAPKIIEIFIAEAKKYQTGAEIYFLMNHPSNEARHKAMKNLIASEYSGAKEGRIERERFFKFMSDIKIYNTSLNIMMDRLEHGMDNVRSVLEAIPEDARAHFYNGEIYRLMAEDRKKVKDELNRGEWRKLTDGVNEAAQNEGWRNDAIKEYELAIKYNPDSAEPYRGLGLLYFNKGENEKALFYLTKYSSLNPDAKDKRYIKNLIEKASIKIGKEKEAK